MWTWIRRFADGHPRYRRQEDDSLKTESPGMCGPGRHTNLVEIRWPKPRNASEPTTRGKIFHISWKFCSVFDQRITANFDGISHKSPHKYHLLLCQVLGFGSAGKFYFLSAFVKRHGFFMFSYGHHKSHSAGKALTRLRFVL